jgi:dihydrodipicolinate synthase/N-acetylneuraminate lyase
LHRKVGTVLTGALAAAITPLRDGGDALDTDAIGPYVDFLAGGGLDGLLALGTTGEGILLGVAERRRVAELYVAAARGRVAVAVHCGAQTTADTTALAAHAAEAGATAVAVIGPPYYSFDEQALLAHFVAAARACAPLPFYLYEFKARTGYSIPLPVVARLREEAPNLRGLKVSDRPFDAVAPYLLEGLDVFIGAEELAVTGLRRGAAGVVSGLAAAFPALMAELVRDPTDTRSDSAKRIRERLERYPFQGALKATLGYRGVPVRGDVRRPLRALTDDERAELERWLESS